MKLIFYISTVSLVCWILTGFANMWGHSLGLQELSTKMVWTWCIVGGAIGMLFGFSTYKVDEHIQKITRYTVTQMLKQQEKKNV
jgi:hypothetical protein